MSYTPIYVLDTTTTDNYQYLRCAPNSTKLTVQVSNAAIYIGFGKADSPGGSANYPQNDEPFLPVMGSVERPPFDEIRVKNYTVNTPAKVFIRAL